MIKKPCILDYIILRDGCYTDSSGNPIATPEPTSGLFVEDLEGLSVENVAQITPEKLTSATNTVIEKLYFAANVVESRLRGILQARGLQLNTVNRNYTACEVTADTYGAQPYDKGLYISKTWLGSPMSSIWVEAVRFKAVNSGQTTIKVKNTNGDVLFSKTLSANAGVEVYTTVRKYFREDVIIVTIDSTNISLYTYKCDSTTSCKPCASKNEYLSVKGWSGTSVTDIAFLSVCLRLDCTDTDIICQFLDRDGVAMALLYQLGVEIAKEWASPNNRLNIIKTHGEEWAVTKSGDWESISIEHLDNEIDSIMQLMKADAFCYNCVGRIVSVPLLP
jgi:hypothetical protein